MIVYHVQYFLHARAENVPTVCCVLSRARTPALRHDVKRCTARERSPSAGSYDLVALSRLGEVKCSPLVFVVRSGVLFFI